MKLLIATFNPGKFQDYKNFAKNLPLDIVSLKDLNITDDFEEIYSTFEDNARAKAEYYFKLSQIPTLADDSGIEIPFYNMQPGVKTKRWAGEKISDQEYFTFILNKIKNIPPDKRQAQLRAVLAYCDGKNTYLEQGLILGQLTDNYYKASKTDGYPWDQVFIIDELKKFYEEVLDDNYNHRKWAFDKLKKYFIPS